MITVKNSFHHTAVQIRAEIGDELTASQIRRARKELCGIRGCLCGGPIGERGPQDGFVVTATDFGRVQIVAEPSCW